MQTVGAPPEADEGQHERFPRWTMAVGALAVVAGVLALLSWNQPPPSEARLSHQSVDAVADLESALETGDVAAVTRLLDPEWAVLDLPGSAQGILPGPGGPAALEFYMETADIDVARCEVEAASGPITYLVECEASVGGDIAQALGYDSSAALTVGVDGEEIVSVFQAPGRRAGAEYGYCIWAEVERSVEATGAFDLHCLPTGDAEVHQTLASGYLEAGSPEPSADVLEARQTFGLVAAMEAFQHEPGTLATIFSEDWPLVRYPGLMPGRLRPPFPSVAEYLAWSDHVYEVELGSCEVVARMRNGGVEIECPQARWGGALVASLGLDPITQPIGFYVNDAEITGVTGNTNPVLERAVVDLCRWARANRNDRAGVAFRNDCAPHYTPQGAVAMVSLAIERRG